MFVPLLIATSLFPAGGSGPTPDGRWGGAAHRAIAAVAEARLSDRAAAGVQALLGDTTLAVASTWADEVRGERPATSPWHYVNISILDSRYVPARDCPAGCVISATETQLRVLSDTSRSRAERSEALKWVVHLVEDLHMPLHSGDRGDRGGNDVVLTYEGRRTNLHAVWDSGMFAEAGLDEVALVARITDRLGRRTDLSAMARGTVIDWANEAHAVSRDVAYPRLPASLALDRRYFEQVADAADLQLVRASVRLAAVLERALGTGED
jgi:hypothetical protein